MINFNQTSANYKYFPLLAMLLTTISLCDMVLIYRTVKLGNFILSAGTFVMPIYYYLTDAIAEVYGYKYCRQATWMMFFCCLLFSLIIAILIHLPMPDATYQIADYNALFSHLFRATIGGTLVTILIATFVNSYIISKWRVLVKGKYFWLRSLGASGIGEAIEVFLECFFLYGGFLKLHDLVTMILSTYIIHLVIGLIIIYPGTMLVNFLKLIEKSDVYDRSISFNPFKFSTEGDSQVNTSLSS